MVRLLAFLTAITFAAPASALTCGVRFTHRDALTTVQGLADGAGQATYRLRAEKRAGGNRSISQQGGSLELDGPGERTAFANVTVNTPPGTRLRADLEISADGETRTCFAETAFPISNAK